MEIIRNREKRESAIATTVIGVILLFILFFAGLPYPDPPIDDVMAMSIQFGESNQGDGDVMSDVVSEIESEDVPEEIAESNPVQSESVEDLATQNVEDNVHIPVESNTTSEAETEPDPEQEINPNAMYPGSSSSSSSSDSQGSTGEPGSQGIPDGSGENPDGVKDGTGFALIGRGILYRPKIVNTSQETGKVVVSIIVDRTGKVMRATPGAKGSTTTSPYLYKLAKAAAMQYKFTANSKAAEEQKGTIVITFKAGR